TVEDGRTCAAALRAAGAPPAEILQKLTEMGLDEETARALLEESSPSPNRRRRRKRTFFGDTSAAGQDQEAGDPLDTPRRPLLYASDLEQAGKRNMLIGAVVFLIGLVVTLATLAAASG